MLCKAQSLIPSRIRLERSGCARKQRTALYSCHCEALRAHLRVRHSTSVHKKEEERSKHRAIHCEPCIAVVIILYRLCADGSSCTAELESSASCTHSHRKAPHSKTAEGEGRAAGSGGRDGGGESATEIEPDWPCGRLRC